MKNFLQDLPYLIKHDLLGVPVEAPVDFDETIFQQPIKISKLAGGGYLAKSGKYPNLYATGDDLEELRAAFYDTILTYFDVPRYFAKRRADNFRIELDGGKVLTARTAIKTSMAAA